MSRRNEDTGLARFAKAERRQRKIEASLDTSWKRYARCAICRHRYVVNNYSDRKVRVNQDKIGGKIVCPWCRSRDGKFLVQLMLIAEQMADQGCQLELLRSNTCKCLSCVANRVLMAHAEAPTRR